MGDVSFNYIRGKPLDFKTIHDGKHFSLWLIKYIACSVCIVNLYVKDICHIRPSFVVSRPSCGFYYLDNQGGLRALKNQKDLLFSTV